LLQHRGGLLRLYALHNSSPVKYLRKQLFSGNESNLLLAAAGLERAVLVEDVIGAAVVDAMAIESELPFTRQAFQARLGSGAARLVPSALELESALGDVLEALVGVRQRLAGLEGERYPDTREDVEQQIGRLLAPGILVQVPREWLLQYPRYFRALKQRVDRLSGQYPKDQKNRQMIAALAEPLWLALERRPALLQRCPDALDFRWLLEEFRVSLFAQALGTRQPVSEKRLRERWRSVEAWLARNPY